MSNPIVTLAETLKDVRHWYFFIYMPEVGWNNPMFIEHQYNYERAEYDML